MDEARIEHIARAMARSAGFDPDAIIGPETGAFYATSMSPAKNTMPAWHRFRRAAENFVTAREEFFDRMPQSRTERERLGLQ